MIEAAAKTWTGGTPRSRPELNQGTPRAIASASNRVIAAQCRAATVALDPTHRAGPHQVAPRPIVPCRTANRAVPRGVAANGAALAHDVPGHGAPLTGLGRAPRGRFRRMRQAPLHVASKALAPR
ncbi:MULTISPECIES: hypothetical protein [Burkholderia]|uniref:hypothetical protein n=1 Tax=Burkholderia TaxID=32008 RepID=UPI000AA7915F|nr:MULTISPECIES: hypothetical protein [Burkholderia]